MLDSINRNDINRKVAQAFNSVFYASYFANMKNGTFSAIRGKDYAAEILKGCADIKSALDSFVTKLVKPEDYNKMKEFCNVDTLEERLRNRPFIECEYRGTFVKGWCKASFISVDYDEDGRLLHILLVIASIDNKRAEELDENITNKKSLKGIFNKIPGGIVMYKWDGKKLRTIKISKYYEEQYGYSMNNDGSPDFKRIHPDDLKEYQDAIHKALTETHEIDYVYRVWNKDANRYLWTHIVAVSENQSDGTSLVYAMYTDVTKQMDAEMLLEKRSASLSAALKASNQLCYEYDPLLHREECLTEDNIFNFPKVIENYPESMLDVVHPDDKAEFLKTVHSMDNGKPEASCNIRLKVGDKYEWYAYRLHSIYDLEKERIIVLLSIIDNTEHIMTIQAYEKRMQALISLSDEARTLGVVNVSDNSFKIIHAQKDVMSIIEKSNTMDDVFLNTSQYVVGKKQQQEYLKLFCRKNLLELAENGKFNVQMDHIYRIGEQHLEWIRTCIDLVKNPQTGDVTGVCYAKSIQEDTIKNSILEAMLNKDYLSISLVYEKSGEYYQFDSVNDEYCVLKNNFWESRSEILPRVSDEDLCIPVDKEKILSKLNEKDEYSYTYYSNQSGVLKRIECRYSYTDKQNGLIMMTLRNVTDAALLKQYKHDSETDLVTGLLNRKTAFIKCRKLIDEHPKEQFVMLHGDVRNFHLYNDFFGEEEGNVLLRSIAERFRIMDKDYKYWVYGRVQADIFCAFFPYDKELLEKHAHYLLEEIPKTHNDFLIEPNIGIYIVKDNSMPIEAMFTRATIAAKSKDRNLFGKITCFTDKMEEELENNQHIIQDTQKAIEEEQFKVYLQPKYSLRTEKIVGSEALVRWIHPEHGIISPGRFIPIFENNGFIVDLDHYMWEHICMLIRKWKDEKTPVYPVSVNVSRVSMYGQGTVEYLKNLVLKYQIEPELLELELTESAYMDDPEDIKRQLKELQDFGFHILMDDFGSGYSSLNTLRELPVDLLKLDMKFISNASDDLRGNIVLSSVIRMSKFLKLPIVAEGVETVDQATYLRGLGCEYVQGYLFAKPMPVSDYEALLPQKPDADKMNGNNDLEKIYSHLTVKSSSAGFISPIPTGFVEYGNGKFNFIRVNKKFLDVFDMNENTELASEVFRQHLSEADYQKFINALEHCAITKGELSFRFNWSEKNGRVREFSTKILYEGKVGNEVDIVAAFMDTTEYSLE